MTARAGEAAAELLGCFPGAVVARGPDWRFGDQDGGPGARGVVREVRRLLVLRRRQIFLAAFVCTKIFS